MAAIALADLALCRILGLSFRGWPPALLGGGAIGAVGLAYYWSGRSKRIADMAHWSLAWIVFSIAGAILTYLAAKHGAAWCDRVLAAFDQRLGFDWPAWLEFIGRHRPLKLVLALAYSSLMPQILGSICYFAYRGQDQRNNELLSGVILALLPTCAVFALFPALGPGISLPELADTYVADLTGLHDGSATAFEITRLAGIIAFPSFHAVFGVLFTYAHRGGAGFYPVAAVNAVMLMSIPSEGEHYLADVLAGVAVALVTIAVIRGMRPYRAGIMRPKPA